MNLNRRLVLAARPTGEPLPETLRLETAEVPVPGPGQMLLRTQYLSLDPYMRGRMSAAPSYTAPVAVGAVMEGGTVAQVVADAAAGAIPSVDATVPPLDALLAERQVRVTSWADWQRIDQAEQERGAAAGRPRAKITAIDEMLTIVRT